MRKDLVTKANDIIQNKNNHSTHLQNKITAVLIANYISPFENEPIEMNFSLTKKELLNLLNMHGGKQSNLLARELKLFNQNCILTWVEKYNREDGSIISRTVSMPFFSELAYYPDTEEVEGKWNEAILPYLRALSSNFTSYSTKEYLRLNSNYSQNFYELMKSYEGQGHVTLSVDSLKEKLNCQDKKTYKEYKEFNRAILQKALQEVNTKTDISVAVVQKFRAEDRKTITALCFEIKSKKIKKAFIKEYPTVLLTKEEYSKLFHGDYDVTVIKQCIFRLHKFLTENPGKTIRSHYNKILEYYRKWQHEDVWVQTSLSDKEKNNSFGQRRCEARRAAEADQKPGAISSAPTYDLEEIKENALNNTDIKY